MKKERLDQLLVNLGHFTSREKAKAAIMSGVIFINDDKMDKPGTKVDVESNIMIKENIHPYVSRGGLKLDKAIKEFQLTLSDRIMMDIGASTGGFTDCALQNGVVKVYTIDVGYGQLAWKLRNDPRVEVMERTNFRYLKPEDLHGELPNFVTIDVSFISVKLILANLVSFLQPDSEVVALIKPQFEAGRQYVGKNGIVKDSSTHIEVLTTVLQAAKELNFTTLGLTYSPIQGGEGNIEFLLYLGYKSVHEIRNIDIPQLVKEAHHHFSQKSINM